MREALVEQAMVHMAAVGLLDGLVVERAADDSARGVYNGHAGDHDGHGKRRDAGKTRCSHKADHAQRGAQQKRSGISHEDAGGVKVVDQKAHAHGDEHDGHKRGVVAHEAHRQDKKARGAYARDARCQAVKPVYEVDDVGKRHQIDDRDGIRQPAQNHTAVGQGDLEPAHEDTGVGDDDGGYDLPQELDAGAQGLDVVDNAHYDDDGDADHHTHHAHAAALGQRERTGPDMRELQDVLDGKGRQKPHVHGHAAHAGDRLFVDAARAGLVHDAMLDGKRAHQGNRSDSHCKGNKEQYEVVPPDKHSFEIIDDRDEGRV